MEDIIHNQPIVNVGVLGHVAHGKSTLVKSITKIKTQRHENEKKSGRTVKLGYANVKIFHCAHCAKYHAKSSATDRSTTCDTCKHTLTLKNHISFVDAPGHECLMTTMLNGTAVMDCAMLVIAANENVPQPQTQEHLIAAEMMGLKNILIIQNKIDLITKEATKKNAQVILDWVKGTCAENSPLIPISAQYGYGVQRVLEALAKLKPAKRSQECNPVFACVRSFDINKPGATSKNLKGGVIGGTLLMGSISIDDKIEIRPGIRYKDSETYTPLRTTVTSIYSEKNSLQTAIPGGLIAVGTELDPFFTAKDSLIGSILGQNLPEPQDTIEIKFFLLRDASMKKLSKGDTVRITALSRTVNAQVLKCNKRKAKLKLSEPLCLVNGHSQLSISVQVDGQWRLVGVASLIERKSDTSTSDESTPIEPDFGRTLPGYEELLQEVERHCENDGTKKDHLTLDPPIISKQGGVRTLFENFGLIAKQLDRDKHHLSQYIASELGTKVSIDANEGMVLYGKFMPNHFESLLRTYIKTYCKCHHCGNYSTKLQEDASTDIIICSFCGRNKMVASIEKTKQYRKGNKVKFI